MQKLPVTDSADLDDPRSPGEPRPLGGVVEPPLDSDSASARLWTMALGVLGVLWLVLLAVPILAAAVQRLDDRVWELAVSAERSALVTFATALDVVGGVVAMGALTVIVALLLARRRRWPALAVWLVVMVASQAVNELIKELYARPRPPLSLITTQSWSFVSGHSLTAAAVAITLVMVWVPAGVRRRNLLLVAAAYAFAMAASRVYLRVHWFSDVAAGVTIGAAIALAVVVAASWWQARSSR